MRGLENEQPKQLTVTVNKNGYVDKSEFYSVTLEKIKNSPLNGFLPHDGEDYDINGSAESWTNFAMRLVSVESDFKTTDKLLSDPGGSYGLFQFGFHYGITQDNWKDPIAQIDAFINYTKQWVIDGGGYINPSHNVQAKRYAGFGGFAAAFSTVRNDKINSSEAIKVAEILEKNHKVA